MKRENAILVVLLCGLLFASCRQRTPIVRRIISLDSLADFAADSALKELHGLESQVQVESEYALRRWQLACIKAQDKAYIPHISDSVIKDVVAYFERYGTVEEKIESYYYLGSVYRDLHDSPKSLSAFLTATDLSEKNRNPNLQLLANVHSQVSETMRRRFAYREALSYAKKGMNLAAANGFLDPIYIMDVATCYKRLGDQDSAIHYYNIALNDILRTNAVAKYRDCISEMSGYYSRYHYEKQSRMCINLLDSLEEAQRPRNYLEAKAVFFDSYDMQDSALWYYEKSLNTKPNFYGIKDASNALMRILSEQGKYDKALRYAKIYAEAEDSIREMLKIEQTRNANNEFQYRRDMEAEVANERRAARAERWLLLTVGGSMILLLGGLLFYVNRRRRLTKQLLEKERSIARLRDEIEIGRKLMEKKQETIAKREAERDSVVRMLRSASAERYYPEIMNRFKNVAKGKATVNSNDWLQLTAAVESQYPGFAATLIDRWPDIKPDCLRIAYLTKMGMEAGDVMRVMEMPKSSFYRKLKRLREVMV